MFSIKLQDNLSKGERYGFHPVVRKQVDNQPVFYQGTAALIVYPLDTDSPSYALYSYGQLVAIYEPWSDRLKLYNDADNYEWSRSTMRHLVSFVHEFYPAECHCIADVRRLADARIPSVNGERVLYDDKKKAWTVVHA